MAVRPFQDLRTAAIWIIAIAFSLWTIVLIIAQQPSGFGPFRTSDEVPLEGRYVVAGVMQFVVLLWLLGGSFAILRIYGLQPIRTFFTAAKKRIVDDDEQFLLRMYWRLCTAMSLVLLCGRNELYSYTLRVL
jgi:hypothetical protein